MRTSLLFLFALAACGGGELKTTDEEGVGGDADDTGASDDTGEGSDDTGDDTSAPACTATLLGLEPGDGAEGVAIDAAVVATFSEEVGPRDVAIEIGGVNGEVTLIDGGAAAVFTPDAPLDRDTTYSVTASVCDDVQTSRFTTVGEELAVDLTGRTYDLELDGTDVTWVKPSQEVGELLMSYVTTNSILFMVESVGSAEIDLVGAAGFTHQGTGELRQYGCAEAIDFAPSSFVSNPAFTAGPMDAQISMGGSMVDIYDLAITGAFAADGESATDVVLEGTVDTRPVSESVGMDVCGLLGSLYGVSCVRCPDGASACLELEVHDRASPWRDGLVVDPDVDPSADPYCG